MAARNSNRMSQRLGWSGGVNLLVDKRAVRDDQLTNGKNCWPTVEGILAKRQAVVREGVVIGQTPTKQYRPLAIFVPDPVCPFDFVAHFADNVDGSEYLMAVRLDQDTEVTAPTVQIAKKPGNNYSPISFCNFQGSVIACGGAIEGFFKFTLLPSVVSQVSANGSRTNTGPGWSWLKCSFNWDTLYTADGWLSTGLAPGASFDQTQSKPIAPRVCCSYRGRMVFANFGIGKGNWLVLADRDTWAWQDLYDETAGGVGFGANLLQIPLEAQIGSDVLAANGRHIELASVQGETIRAMMEISIHQLTSGLGTALLVLTDRSAVIITGEVSETTDTGTTYSSYLGDWVPAKVNFDCGCAGVYAITRSPTGIFWANGDDVYALYSGAPQPVPIGTNIRPALQSCPASYQPFWCMAYADGAIYLAVATSDSTNELQLNVNHWRLDVRPVPGSDQPGAMMRPQSPDEARWWGPQDYSNIPNISRTAQGAMGACIVSKRIVTLNQNVIYGFYFGDASPVAPGLFAVSFNRVYQGRDVPYLEAISGRAWAPNENVQNGDVVMPTPLARNGRLYAVVTTLAGVTGGAEPTWPTDGITVVADGTVGWQEVTGGNYAIQVPNCTAKTMSSDIAMEPDFKEYDGGAQNLDMVFRRAFLTAYFSNKQQAWLDVLGNGGNLEMQMGPCVIGDFTLGRTAAFNDLGLALLDFSALAQEFQSRQLRPGDSSRHKLDVVVPGVVRGRTLQPRFREGKGFIIDDSNNYIVWAGVNGGLALKANPLQAQIPSGYYDNVVDLMTAIVTAMNAATPVGSILGGSFTVAANPWSFDDPFVAVRPYMMNFTLTFSARGGRLCFLSAFDPTDAVVFGGVTTYVGRCGTLLATLGFDTSDEFVVASGFTPPVDDHNVPMNVIGETFTPLSASPTHIFATQVQPYTQSTVVSISDLRGEFTMKSGLPMSLTGRQS